MFNVDMLDFPSVAKITTFNVTKYINNYNLKTPS